MRAQTATGEVREWKYAQVYQPWEFEREIIDVAQQMAPSQERKNNSSRAEFSVRVSQEEKQIAHFEKEPKLVIFDSAPQQTKFPPWCKSK